MRKIAFAVCAVCAVCAGLGGGCGVSSDGPDGAAVANDAGACDAADAQSSDVTTRDTGSSDAATEADVAPPPCPDGATLLADRTACPSARPGALASAAVASVRGDVITLGGVDEGALPCLPVRVCAPADAPTLLFSDSPESPSANGVLYADVVPAGRFRVYVYHANGGTTLRKFPVVVLNEGAVDAHVTIEHAGVAPAPSQDYVGIGKAVAKAWLASQGGATITVPAGMRVLLDAALDALHAANAELVHAIYDLRVDAPVKISVVSVDASTDAAAAASGLSLLTAIGGDGRGTFAGADVLLVPSAPLDAIGMAHLRLGGGVTDDDLRGVDATSGLPVTLKGNFGVLYRMRFDARANVALAVAPRGTDWGGAAEIAPGVDAPTPFVLLPRAQTSLGTVTDAISLGRFAAGSAPYVRLFTAGGSNLPIDVVIAPLP